MAVDVPFQGFPVQTGKPIKYRIGNERNKK
jgi:hypothetical protein